MLRFWFFHLDSICYEEFDVNSISIFSSGESYISPINLCAAMLNYSGEAGEAGDDSERSTPVDIGRD